MENVKITIVGAGAVGLACAAELSKIFTDVVVIEKNNSFGRETSSRNSEVIHAGIYYPPDSLKARLCVEGKRLLYAYCQEHHIGYKRLGKLIVAINPADTKPLEELCRNGLKNGVNDLKILSAKEVKKMEPRVNAIAAIYSPSTGIIDSHSLMKSLETESINRKTMFAYDSELVGVEKQPNGFKIAVRDPNNDIFYFVSQFLVNAAGFSSDKIACLAGLQKKEYVLKYCKGDYFRVSSKKAACLSHLVYPVIDKENVSLGVHAILDLAGGLRLGPDAEYVDEIDYAVDESKKESFYRQCRPMLPFIELEDLSADMSGIRAKLQGQGEGFRDFVVREETGQGLPGLINLIGIDSPGLTSSLAIAKEVKKYCAVVGN